METGLKSCSLPHKRVLITIPDRKAPGKRGLDLPLRGSGGVSVRGCNSGGCGSQGGGQGCQDTPTANGRGCVPILSGLYRVHGLGPRIREQPIKIHAVNCKMWNRGLEGLLREGKTFAGRTALPFSKFASPKCAKYKTQQTNKRSVSAPSLPHAFWGKTF